MRQSGYFARLQPETDAVLIEAKFEDEVMIFKSHLSSRMEGLEEQVARKPKMEIGSIKSKYLDEDEQRFLLTCDEDLQLCLMTSAPVQLQVELIGTWTLFASYYMHKEYIDWSQISK
ncbi:hypothetical protein F511_20358 [Dorcoceras hygrometricum]|uniref:PB1 domain-containing protein n=1 Tax=Dorcoceras hygrometricum TaxID=472368 RepID=A0A2Z7A2L0_9LAMI|nr:hypothetical protein F511_20358 [Dorcoceras hygrometricum]